VYWPELCGKAMSIVEVPTSTVATVASVSVTGGPPGTNWAATQATAGLRPVVFAAVQLPVAKLPVTQKRTVPLVPVFGCPASSKTYGAWVASIFAVPTPGPTSVRIGIV